MDFVLRNNDGKLVLLCVFGLTALCPYNLLFPLVCIISLYWTKTDGMFELKNMNINQNAHFWFLIHEI